jgi:hypothetical protein
MQRDAIQFPFGESQGVTRMECLPAEETAGDVRPQQSRSEQLSIGLENDAGTDAR